MTLHCSRVDYRAAEEFLVITVSISKVLFSLCVPMDTPSDWAAQNVRSHERAPSRLANLPQRTLDP